MDAKAIGAIITIHDSVRTFESAAEDGGCVIQEYADAWTYMDRSLAILRECGEGERADAIQGAALSLRSHWERAREGADPLGLTGEWVGDWQEFIVMVEEAALDIEAALRGDA